MKYLSKHPEWLVIDLGANIGKKKFKYIYE